MPLSTSELLAKTRRLEIRTSRLVNELFGGRYHSTFKGRGVEFVDVREYVPGDDIRTIHWPLTARANQPYVKRFVEERELTILIAVDISNSNRFGTHQRLKSELAAELVALLTFATLKNNDKVGLMLFSDRVEKYIPPRKSKSHALRLIREVLGAESTNAKTDINASLDYLNRIQKKRAVVFIISDFLGSHFEKALGLTQKHHDTIAFVLEDVMEKTWPKIGRVLLEDAETGERTLVRATRDFLANYVTSTRSQQQIRDKIFSKIGTDTVTFKTNSDYVKPLLTFFQGRKRVRR